VREEAVVQVQVVGEAVQQHKGGLHSRVLARIDALAAARHQVLAVAMLAGCGGAGAVGL
jgi:hypothetical protein